MAYFYPLLHCPPKFPAPPPVGKQGSFCDDFSQTLVSVGDSQIPSQVPDSQPAYDSKVAVTPLPVSDLVAQVAAEVAARLATTKKNKDRREVERALKTGQERNATMKWLPFMSSFVLEKMCGLIQNGVYNHLRKWRQRWLTISRLRDQRGSKDVEFLNVPIANYDEMHTIFSFGLAIGKYAMGSKGAGKRKRGAFADDELVAFTNMTVVVKDVTHAIRDNKPTDMHPKLYNAVMDMLGFAENDLMATPSHLVDHRAQCSSFIGMIEPHRILWLRNYLGKRVRGIYNSWIVCQDQVNGYSNNSYRGYKTLEEAQQEYLTFLKEDFLEDQAIDEAVPLAQLPPEEGHALQGAPPEVRPIRVKDYIIVFLFLIVVIVRILFF
ncbi:hypothetical protein QYE76_012697 [Lolium multiflorum]|uniref:Ribonuclease H1 N-terminal domain-containing protein n=1 Tax=Lolium multiflorum TaxID=4521 RepID=A0AAD8U1K8_LOLMU|nr:hypothetical protein QYE76_012697 [Lolium multiflorum]